MGTITMDLETRALPLKSARGTTMDTIMGLTMGTTTTNMGSTITDSTTGVFRTKLLAKLLSRL